MWYRLFLSRWKPHRWGKGEEMKRMQHGLWKKGIVAVGLTIGLIALGGGLAEAVITGSAHDFSGQPYSGYQICVVCHAPHNVGLDAPLWNHEVTTSVFTLYSSPTLNATPGQPDGASKLCLSCHDGTVAIDSFGGATGTNFVGGTANLGTDLSNDHPISFTYDAGLASDDGGVFDPTVQTVTIGSGSFTKTGTINAVMLQDGKVQCSSCHDVHNDFVAGGIGGDPLLKISKDHSEICLACHNK